MQNFFARLGSVRLLLLKSEQLSFLIDKVVQVGASIDKHGHRRDPFTRIQKVRVERPAQPDLFGDAQVPEKTVSPQADLFSAPVAAPTPAIVVKKPIKVTPQVISASQANSIIFASADSVKTLRKMDVDRVLHETPAIYKLSMAQYIKDNRRDLEDEVDQVMAEQAETQPVLERNQTVLERNPIQEDEPKEGDHKTENGVDYVLRDGRWHNDAVEVKPVTDKPEVKPLGAKAKRALEVLQAGGFFRKQLHTQYRGGEKFETHLHNAGHGLESGIGYKTFKELEHAGLLQRSTDIPRSTVWREEWTLRKQPLQPKINPVIAENPQIIVANEPQSTNNGQLDYPAFKAKYQELFRQMMKYSPNEAGSSVFAEKLAEFTDSYPEFTERVENEVDGHVPETNFGNIEPFGVSAGISKPARRELNKQAADIVSRGGPFSDADKAILRQYSGNGGCGDSLNEFYTLPEVAGAMWNVARRLGVKGDVLEPSCGPGVFLHTAPSDSRVTGVELDDISAKIAKALHGDKHEINNASLERFATQDERQFDGVLGNVPFGLRGGLISADKSGLKTAEAYFCDTAMDKCKAGGIVGLIVPTGVMDSKTNRKLREALLRKGQFLGAQRMPNTAFEHSHTEVTTDVIWFKKFPDDVAGALSSKAVSQDHLKALGIWDDQFLSGSYFTTRGAENVLGKMEAGWRAKAGMGADITVEGSMKGVPESIAEFQPEEIKPAPHVTAILDAVGTDAKLRATVLGGAMNRPYADKSKVGDTKTVDGIAYVLQGKPPRWHRIDEVLQSEALTKGQNIAERIDALLAGETDIDRPKLEADLRAWIEEHGIPSKNKDILLGARADKTLYRLIGSVKSDGSLSDAVLGKVVERKQGSFEATIRGLLNDHETVGVTTLAKAAGVDNEEALDQLYGSDKYAIDAQNDEWTTKDIYLTGDLWAKSDAVKAALAGEGLTPEMRKKLEQQEVMLTEAIAPVSLEDAFIEMNSAFIPTTVLSAFLEHTAVESGWKKYNPDNVEVTFGDGVYVATGSFPHSSDFMKYMNRDGLKKDDKHIIDDMNVAYKDWLCASPEYRTMVEDLYNRKFRGYQEREFSNEPMDIQGMNTEGLKDYQWGTLRWALNAGKGVIASDVGLGKTSVGLMLAKTLKATGQAKRPLIVVPKSVLENWVAECEKWFPGSNILTIGGDKDGPVERKRKYHDLQQNDYDFIIISEPSFEELDLDPITKGEMNSQDFWVKRGDSLKNAGDKRTKQIKTAYQQALAKQTFGEDTRTDATYFNQLGIDAIIADEFHHQKSLVSIKTRFGDSPKYMGGSGQSMRALDFNLKSRWLLNQNDGKNVYGLTATVLKNSPIELYAALSHVAPEALEKIGIRNSEEFIDRFAQLENGLALNTQGAMEDALLTTGFKNMDELRTMMKRFIRRKTADDVGLILPSRQDITHMIDMDDEQQAKYSELRELAAESGGKDATGDNHIFSIMDKMNKAAMDMSMLDSSYDGKKSPKYVACAAEVVKNSKDGGQIIFSDYIDSHEKMAAALVASGIQRNQIGIINAKAAKSSKDRQKICDAFNAGKLKVVIGNTTVMGEGLNLQKGTSDIHHMDLPWEPASMQQRNGRGLRQGNTNAGVRIHSYLAKGSFDGYRLQSILGKKDIQDMIWNGGNEVENLNRKGNISRDEMMIMLSADPDQARAKFEADTKGKEERLAAGKTTDAAQRFAKFQETKRSYGALKSKDNQSAMRLKAKLDKEYSSLKADKYFTAKAALDIDTPVIVAPSGTVLHAGAGIEIKEDDKQARYVVTGVDQRSQLATIRRYGDESQAKRTVAVKDLPGLTSFAYDEPAETAEISKKIAERPIELKNLSDAYKLSPAVIAANHDAIQRQIWDGVTNYKISVYGGKIPLIEKATGKAAVSANAVFLRSRSRSSSLMRFASAARCVRCHFAQWS